MFRAINLWDVGMAFATAWCARLSYFLRIEITEAV
jgi:hypothetical protein